MPLRETILESLDFPVEVFVQDNLRCRFDVLPHWHDGFEILYMLQGCCRQRLGDRFSDLRAGDLVLVPNGEVHATTCGPRDDVRILVVKFLPWLLLEGHRTPGEFSAIRTALRQPETPVIHLDDSFPDRRVLDGLFAALLAEAESPTPVRELAIRGHICLLLAFLIRHGLVATNPPEAGSAVLPDALGALLARMEADPSAPLTLAQAASSQNLSPSHFSRTFRRLVGRGFKRHLDALRIDAAERRLLQDPADSVLSIALASGFASDDSFYRTYRRIRGRPFRRPACSR